MNEMSLFSRYYDMKKHAAVKEQKTLDASVKVNTIGNAPANYVEFHGIRPQMYIEDLLW